MAIRQKLPRFKQLRALRVKDPTLIKYAESVDKFKAYCKRRKLSVTRLELVDRSMATFFADLCEEGASYNDASYTLFGFIVLEAQSNLPERQLFPLSRGALKGWSSRYPQCSRTGADPLLWHLIAEHMLGSAPMYAAVGLIQLDTYARPSEILGLRKQDIIKPSSRHCCFWGIIFGNSSSGGQTKTGTQDDTVLLDSTDREYAKQILAIVFAAAKRPHDRLFPGASLREYEAVMREAKRAAGLGAMALTPHAVRHSGPSIDFLHRTRLPEEILARGRWKTLRSIQRYQKPGQMLSRMGKVDHAIWAKARASLPRILSQLKKAFNGGPPSKH